MTRTAVADVWWLPLEIAAMLSPSSKVAPGMEPQEMQRETLQVCPSILESAGQPHYSNGCPIACCGNGPAAITVEQIKKLGNESTRWIQKSDGRVIEYYVYGSESADARIFVQIHGSMSSAKMFSKTPGMISALKEHNVKGIGINLPGHGFTSPEPHRRLGAWPATDVAPVLAAEKVPEDAPLLVEGSSFGSSHAFSFLNHFQDRVAGVHFHVPAVSQEAAKELMLPPVKQGLPCDANYATGCFLMPGRWCSPCLFCCCSYVGATVPDSMSKGLAAGVPGLTEVEGFDAIKAMKEDNLQHCMAAGWQGPMVYSTLLGQVQKAWGFHPFGVPEDKVAKMRIMVSYGEKDTGCPEAHGVYIGEYFSKHCNKEGKQFNNVAPEEVEGNVKGGKCLVNHKPNGHTAHLVTVFDGSLLKKFLQLVDSS